MKLPRSVVCLLLAACSSTSNETNITFAPDAGEAGTVGEPGHDAGPIDLLDAGADSTPDVDADAGPVVGACGDDQSTTSESCTPSGPCSDGTCTDGYRYTCLSGARPAIPGCQATTANGNPAFCCPPACVRNKNDDVSCSGGKKEYLCPTFADGGLVVAAPSGCDALTANTFPSVAYCCP
jgi:hypothetical protein